MTFLGSFPSSMAHFQILCFDIRIDRHLNPWRNDHQPLPAFFTQERLVASRSVYTRFREAHLIKIVETVDCTKNDLCKPYVKKPLMILGIAAENPSVSRYLEPP